MHWDNCITKILKCLKRVPSIEPRATAFFIKDGKKEEFENLFNKYFSEYFNLYTKEEVDLIFCYSIITKEYCLLTSVFFEEKKCISIRSGNGIAGNKHKYNCFSDFDFDSVCVETLHEIPNIHRIW